MALELDPRKTALVMIDLQMGIMGQPRAPHAVADVLDRNVSLARALRRAGGFVVAVRVDFGHDGSLAPKGQIDGARLGALSDDFARLHADVVELEPDLIVTKHQWGAFHGTDLNDALRRRGVDTVLVGGIATNFGVESTAREGWSQNYSMVVIEDACTSFSAEWHGFSVEAILPRIARVRSTEAVLAALEAKA